MRRPPDDEKKARRKTGPNRKDGNRDGDPKATYSTADAVEQQDFVWPWLGRLPVRPHLRPKPRFGKQELDVCVELAKRSGVCPHQMWDYLYFTPYFERVNGLMYQGSASVNEALSFAWDGEA